MEDNTKELIETFLIEAALQSVQIENLKSLVFQLITETAASEKDALSKQIQFYDTLNHESNLALDRLEGDIPRSRILREKFELHSLYSELTRKLRDDGNG